MLQIGLLLGPACNLFLREIHFTVLGFEVSKLNAPGLFLAVMYVLYEIAIVLFYFDLARAAKIAGNSAISAADPVRGGSKESGSGVDSPDGVVHDDAEEDLLARPEVVYSSVEALIPPNEREDISNQVSWAQYKNELLRGEIVALIFLRFMALFGQTCMEVCISTRYFCLRAIERCSFLGRSSTGDEDIFQLR